MQKTAFTSFVVFAAMIGLSTLAGPGPVVDDFSHGGWNRFSTTPGTLTVAKGRLTLRDAPGGPGYVTAARTFRVNLDATPWFIVRVKDVSDRGTVKLIRRDPYDKRVALRIDRPGLYAVDVRREFRWRGTHDVQVCLYAVGDEAEITYEFVKFAPALSRDEERAIAERRSGGNMRLRTAPFEVVPLFNACSVYFHSEPREGLGIRFRRIGDARWSTAFPPPYFPADHMYRGSIVGLREGTEYELQVIQGESTVLAGSRFRTWTSAVPVARTVVLDAANFPGTLTITDKDSGTADGWVRFTARPGFVLRNDRKAPLIDLYKARYVILEGLTLRGGSPDAIAVRRCRYVRIVNCDIAGWGRIGKQRFDRDGKFYTEKGGAVNWDTGIRVSRSVGTVIERCYVHDPVSTANSWYYSHPAGPQAAGMDRPQATVVRYNDFIGSDLHRWNDGIEGAGNFDVDGGFNRDADVYGNFICFANDDAIEIDGGQTNVRVFLNRFEGCLCGVSIQGCMSSPSYVFRNLLVFMGDERGLAGQTIKTSSHANGPDATSFIFNNTCYGRSFDLHLVRNLRIVAMNNIFAGRGAISGRASSPQSTCDYNLLAAGKAGEEPHGVVGDPAFVNPTAGLFDLRPSSPAIGRGTPLANFAPGRDGRVDMGALPFRQPVRIPFRPVPVTLDRKRIVFTPEDVREGRTVQVTARPSDPGFRRRFRVVWNDAFDWLEVTPRTGSFEAGKRVTLIVRAVPRRTPRRPLYRGAFLVRFPDGFSLPVTVYARTDVVLPVKPTPRPGVWTAYCEAESPASGTPGRIGTAPDASGGRYLLLDRTHQKAPLEYRFRVPAKGVYFVVMRIRTTDGTDRRGSVMFGLDEGRLERARLRAGASWGWSLAAHNRSMSLICLLPFRLNPGEHVLKLGARDSLAVDIVALTSDPKPFEPLFYPPFP